MAEVFHALDGTVADESGAYRALVIGRQAADGMWEGWLEFRPIDPDDAGIIVSPVESRQPQRDHLVYWATGLTSVYLEGALARARQPVVVRPRVAEEPASDAPAPAVVAGPPKAVTPAAALDPFEVGRRSFDLLDQELRALNRPRLLNIIAAFDLNPGREDLGWMSDAQLVRFIVVATEAQMTQRSRDAVRATTR